MYVTSQDVEARLGTALTSSQAAYFDGVLVDSITSYINSQTMTQFASDEIVDVYVDDNFSATIVIPTMHDITAVSYVMPDGTTTLIPDTEYYQYPRTGANKYALKRFAGSWVEGWPWYRGLNTSYDPLMTYKITGKLGYKELPADIKWAATELAIRGMAAYTGNVKRERVGDWDVIYADPTDLPSQLTTVLNNYRRASRSIL